jgi:excisionase family DNA binding protein
MIPNIYSIKDVAKMLDVSRRTVEIWIRSGKIQKIKIGGRSYIREEELIRIMTLGTT